MDWKKKLCFKYYEKNIIEFINSENCCLDIIIKLTAKGIFNFDVGENVLAEKDLSQIVKEIYFINLIEFFEKSGKPRMMDFAKKICDFQAVWTELLNRTKEERKKESSKILLFPFDELKTISLADIVKSVGIREVIKTNLNDIELIDTDIKYSNFYELFRKNFNKILIQGSPGIGKTVQVKYLTHKWAVNEWNFENDKLLIVIILRDVDPDGNMYEDIIKQNFKHISFITEDIIEEMILEKYSNIILFLDGADEFNDQQSQINKYIEYGFCDISTVIWSRKWRAERLWCTCDAVYELTGLDKESMKEFFEKCFLNKDLSDQFIKIVTPKSEHDRDYKLYD